MAASKNSSGFYGWSGEKNYQPVCAFNLEKPGSAGVHKRGATEIDAAPMPTFIFENFRL
jgi:hypothetical protein